VTDSAGYAGDIKFSVGVGTDGTYKGTSILSISETAGLGMRAKTDPSFLSQFNNVKVDSFTLVKDGTGSSADDKIDAISGSTVTSKAMTSGINAALAEYSIIRAAGAKTVGGAGIE
jgi:electron transport complex protein RnfG